MTLLPDHTRRQHAEAQVSEARTERNNWGFRNRKPRYQLQTLDGEVVEEESNKRRALRKAYDWATHNAYSRPRYRTILVYDLKEQRLLGSYTNARWQPVAE